MNWDQIKLFPDRRMTIVHPNYISPTEAFPTAVFLLHFQPSSSPSSFFCISFHLHFLFSHFYICSAATKFAMSLPPTLEVVFSNTLPFMNPSFHPTVFHGSCRIVLPHLLLEKIPPPPLLTPIKQPSGILRLDATSPYPLNPSFWPSANAKYPTLSAGTLLFHHPTTYPLLQSLKIKSPRNLSKIAMMRRAKSMIHPWYLSTPLLSYPPTNSHHLGLTTPTFATLGLSHPVSETVPETYKIKYF